MKSRKFELPERLQEQVEALVEGGWFKREEDVVTEAVRRFLEVHRPERMEEAVWEDVAWGLRGES